MTTKGKLIVLEGIDGAGTTTQAKKLAARLNELDFSAYFTFEPSQGPIGKLIRQFLAGEHQPPRMMAQLFSADRWSHLATEIIPKLNAGVNVICDRYILSTMVYQSVQDDHRVLGGSYDSVYPFGIDREYFQWLTSTMEGVRNADLTIFLRTPLEVAQKRRQQRSDTTEFYEASEEQARVHSFYDEIIRHRYDKEFGCDQNVVSIDGSLSMEEVSRRVEIAALNCLYELSTK